MWLYYLYFTNILSPLWARVASSKVNIVIILERCYLRCLDHCCMFLSPTGPELNIDWYVGHRKRTFFLNLLVISGGHKRSDSTEACLTPHLLQPFATEPYSQLCLSSVSLSALALIKVMSLEGRVTSNYILFWRPKLLIWIPTDSNHRTLYYQKNL